MLTVEERKKLMPGDKVLAEIEVFAKAPDGLLWVSSPDKFPYEKLYPLESLSHPSAKPKYDPCRRFKAGDKVRIVQCKGRDFSDETKMYRGRITEVLSDEDNYSVETNLLNEAESIEGITIGIDPAYLELVTPVDERVYFRVGDFPVNGEWSVWKDSLEKTEIISSYKIDTHPNAKKAAEAERDRLNAEHRKEQR